MQKTFNVFVPLKDVLRQIDVHYEREANADFVFQMSIEGAIEKRLRRDKISTGGAGLVCHLIPKDQRLSKDKLKVYAVATDAVFGGDKIGVKIALDPLFDGAVSRHIISLCKSGDDDEYAELAAALKSTPPLGSFERVNEFLNSLDAEKIAIWITVNFAPFQTVIIPDRGFEINGAEQAWATQGLESAIRFAAGLRRFNAAFFPCDSDIDWRPKISTKDGTLIPRVHAGKLEVGKDGRVKFLALFKACEDVYGYDIPEALVRYFKAAKWRLDKEGAFTAQRKLANGNNAPAAGEIEFRITAAPEEE